MNLTTTSCTGLISTLREIEPFEVLQYLDIESLINIYLTSKELQPILDRETILERLHSLHGMGKHHVISFPHFSLTFDIEKITKRTHLYISINESMIRASKYGRLDIVLSMMAKGAIDYGPCLNAAAKGGHLDIFLVMSHKKGTDMKKAALAAVEGGQLKILQLLLEYEGPKDTQKCMDKACEYGHLHIIEHLMLKPGINYNCVLYAADKGRLEVVKLLVDRCDSPHSIMGVAANNGHVNIVQFMLDRGATDTHMGILAACSRNYVEVVKLLLSRGATNYNECMNNATHCSSLDVIKHLLPLATNHNECLARVYNNPAVATLLVPLATNHNECMLNACRYYGDIEVVHLMLKYGANNYNECMLAATMTDRQLIVKLMLERGATNADECMTVAIKNDNYCVADILLQCPLDYNKHILEAIRHGNLTIVKMLLEYATNINICMLTATMDNSHTIVKLMLDHGATNAWECMSYAVTNQYLEVVSVLLQYPLDNDKYMVGALKDKDIATVRALLKVIADTNRQMSRR